MAVRTSCTAYAACYRIYEVPIDYSARTRAQGKKLTWRDGVMAMVVLFRIRLSTAQSLFGQPDPYHAERLNQLSAALISGAGESRGTFADEQSPRDKG